MATTTSVMQDLTADFIPCYICGRTAVDVHHCLHGTANRHIADKYKLTVGLCRHCHTLLHDMGMFDTQLKERAQQAFEREYGSREEFIEIFGKSFL